MKRWRGVVHLMKCSFIAKNQCFQAGVLKRWGGVLKRLGWCLEKVPPVLKTKVFKTPT